MSTSSSVVSRVEITAKSKAESETIEKYIRINHIRFGPEFQAAPESELGNALTYQSTGLPYLKNSAPWEYPYLRILIQFTDAYIEIHYPSEGETKSTSFGRPIAPEARSVVKIRPSDLTFLLQCPKCFYMKYNFGFTQPFVSVSGGMAGALAEKEELALIGEPTNDWCPEIIPPGTFDWQGETIASDPLPVEGRDTYYLGGIFDLLAELEDNTFAVVDCKTTGKEAWKLRKLYAPQLMAYWYCLENPIGQEFSKTLNTLDRRTHRQPTLAAIPRKVSHLGLLCFNLNSGDISASPQATTFSADVSYIPMKIDGDKFIEKMQEVATLLEQPTMPESGKYCYSCKWLKEMVSFQSPGKSLEHH
jgi:hypothetical protein